MDLLISVWDLFCRFVYEAWTGFGWPHAALFIVIIVVKFFSAELKLTLQRINKLGQWAEFQPMTENSQPSVNPPAQEQGGREGAENSAIPLASYNLPSIQFPDSMALSKKTVISEIDSMDEHAAKSYLIEHLAFWRVTAEFEYINGVIFGGQLGFLRGLGEKGVFGTSLAEARNLWANFQPTLKPNFEGWSVEHYLNFLTEKGLMTLDGETYHITLKGREFISWMIRYGRPFNRAM